MDFVQRNEAKEKAIKEFWNGLVEQLKDAVTDWNKHTGLTLCCNRPDQHAFAVSRRRTDGKIVGLFCEFNQHSGEVVAKKGDHEGPPPDAPIDSLHQIVVDSTGTAFLRRNDGSKVDSLDDAADAILLHFLQSQK